MHYKKLMSRQNLVHVIENVRVPEFSEIAADLLTENDEDPNAKIGSSEDTTADDGSVPGTGFTPDPGATALTSAWDTGPASAADASFTPDTGFTPDSKATMSTSAWGAGPISARDTGFAPVIEEGKVEADLTESTWASPEPTGDLEEELKVVGDFDNQEVIEEDDEASDGDEEDEGPEDGEADLFEYE